MSSSNPTSDAKRIEHDTAAGLRTASFGIFMLVMLTVCVWLSFPPQQAFAITLVSILYSGFSLITGAFYVSGGYSTDRL